MSCAAVFGVLAIVSLAACADISLIALVDLSADSV